MIAMNHCAGPSDTSFLRCIRCGCNPVHHIDLGAKVWPNVFAKTLRVERGYATGLFGKVCALLATSLHAVSDFVVRR